jgi:hypothetical protein
MNDKSVNFNKSVELDKKLVPIALRKFGYNGPCISIEGTEYDTMFGIDFLTKDDKGIHTFATRIRYAKEGGRYWSDFTVRQELYPNTPSEYLKRTSSIKEGSLYPTYTLQAWFTEKEEFVSGAVIETQHLYHFINKYWSYVGTSYSDRPFLTIDWNKIQSKGYPISIINK